MGFLLDHFHAFGKDALFWHGELVKFDKCDVILQSRKLNLFVIGLPLSEVHSPAGKMKNFCYVKTVMKVSH